MAVSYLSKPLRSDPYVLPLDLNLFAQVLGTKERQFETGAAKMQQNIDQLGALDVLKDEDRQYLNNKINNIVSSVNNLGGVDYSDPATLNQLEGLGADIYGDKDIMTAVASTKSVRNLQNTYQQYKTNPKLSKLYSPVNEAWDMQNVNAWLKDGQKGTAYQGPSTPTQFIPYRENHLKMLKNLTANMRTSIDANGNLMYITTENKFITPEQVAQTAADLLLPEERDQMKRDGWFLYKDANPNDVLKQALTLQGQKLDKAMAIQNQYKAQADASVSDPKARQHYLDMAASQDDEIKNLKAAVTEISKNGAKKFMENPREFMYNTYAGQYYRGLGERFAFNQSTKKVSPNFAEIAKQKLDQAERFHNDEMKNKALELGLKYSVDPITGKVTVNGKKNPNDPTDPSTVTENATGDVDVYKRSEDIFKKQNEDLEARKESMFRDYFFNIASQEHPELLDLTESKEGGGRAYKLKGSMQTALESVNRKAGLQLEDLNVDPNSKEFQAVAGKEHLTKEQMDWFKNLHDTYVSMSEGKDLTGIKKLPTGFTELHKNYELLNEQIKANTSKIEGIKSTIYSEAKLTPEEINTYEDYKKNPSKYKIYPERNGKQLSWDKMTPAEKYIHPELNPNNPVNKQFTLTPAQQTIMFGPGNDNPVIAKIKSKLNSVNADSAIEKYYQAVENRPNFGYKVITNDNPLVKSGEAQNIFVNNLHIFNQEDYPVEKVHVRRVGLSSDGLTYEMVGEVPKGKDGKVEEMRVKLEPNQALKFGLQHDPLDALNQSVAISGRSNPLHIYGGKGVALKVVIARKDLKDRNSPAFAQVAISDNNGGYHYVKIPGTERQTPSLAYAAMESRLKDAVAKGAKREDILKGILDEYYNTEE